MFPMCQLISRRKPTIPTCCCKCCRRWWLQAQPLRRKHEVKRVCCSYMTDTSGIGTTNLAPQPRMYVSWDMTSSLRFHGKIRM
jgi:hypothetical protein